MTTWARRTSAAAAAAFLTLGLAACQGQDEGRSPDPDGGDVTTLTPTDDPTEDETTEPAYPPSSEPADERVEAAVADLAARLEVASEDIGVGPLEKVTWSDSAIGCPEPDQMYTQALVPGVRLILTVEGTEYAYHGEGDEPLFYCANPVDPAPSEGATA